MFQKLDEMVGFSLPLGSFLLCELSSQQRQPYHTQFSVSEIDRNMYVRNDR